MTATAKRTGTCHVKQHRKGGPYVLEMDDARYKLPPYDEVRQDGRKVTLHLKGVEVLKADLPKEGWEVDEKTNWVITFRKIQP
jgi:hypothetical protein